MSTTNNDVVSESSKQHRYNTKNTINPTVQVLEQIETDAVMEWINMMHYLNTKISTILNDINNQPSLDTLNAIVREVSSHRETLAKCYDKVTSTAQSPTPAEVETMHTTTEQTLRTIETQAIQVLRITESKQTEQKVSVANERVTKPSRQLSRRSHKAKSSQCELERKVRQLQSDLADQQYEIEINQIKDQLEQKQIKDQLEQKRIKDQLEQKQIKAQLEQKQIRDQLEQKEMQHKMKVTQRQLDRATEELSIKDSGSNCSLSTSCDNLEDYSTQTTVRYVYNRNNVSHNTPVTHSPVSTDDKYIRNLNLSHTAAICNINDQPADPQPLNMQPHGTSNGDRHHSMPIQQIAPNLPSKTDTYIRFGNNVDNIPSFRPKNNPTNQSLISATVETNRHDDITTATVNTDLPHIKPVTTKLQMQQSDVAIIIQLAANQEFDSTPQIITDTSLEPEHTTFWHHLHNTYNIHKTVEFVNIAFNYCYSEYSCEILYLLLYS